MRKQRILFVDDDPGVAEAIGFTIEQQGRDVTVRHSVDEALAALLEEAPFDAIITDLRMPGRDGLELVRELQERDGAPPVVVLTAHGSVDVAVEAMKAGAVDFLEKPVGRDVLRMVLDRVVRSVDLERENEKLRREVERLTQGGDELIARSKVMRDVLEVADRVAATDATVLVTGESGTGKELVARRLHRVSPRAERGFVAVNCAALPRDLLESELFGHKKGAFTGATDDRKGRFVEANGGTLFLDEIGDMDLELQSKLLRVLQDGVVDIVGGGRAEVDVRIVAATHQDLEGLVRDGRFREDLFFRINVVPVRLPPLRERGQDVPLLFAALLRRAAERAGAAPPAVEAGLLEELARRPWPGNVRELENVATRMAVTAVQGASLTAADLLATDGAADVGRRGAGASGAEGLLKDRVTLPPDGVSLEAVERALIVSALSAARGNRSQAARLLQVPRHVLLYRMEKFAIEDDEVSALRGSSSAPIVDVPASDDD